MAVTAQIPWRDSTTGSQDIAWDNYSTSYLGPNRPDDPFLITAIPYNGRYDNGPNEPNAPLDMTFTGSLFRFRSTLTEKNTRTFYTIDSSEVYFIAAGIHPENAHLYEFMVMEDGKQTLARWQSITRFTDDTFSLNNFKPRMGWLGGFKTTWGKCIVVLLRKKGEQAFLSASAVCWQETKPLLLGIYTSATFSDFFDRLKNPYIRDGNKPDTFPFPSVVNYREQNLIFYVEGNIFKRGVLEYKLNRNDAVYTDWKMNDVDNNFIWLRDLPPGKYQLSLRFAAQRHNVSMYPFEVAPAWYQTGRFKLIAGIFTAILIGTLILLLQVLRQRRKITLEQLKKAELQLALQSVYAQLNPHFVFNALHSIQGLINKNDIAGANRYLAVFGNLMRDSLTSNHKDMAPLSQEVSTLDTYLKLEQLRFGFDYSITVEDTINQYETEIPSLFLQPLVENAVKHGVGTMQEKGKIAIRFKRRQQNLEVYIEDNGQGFDTSATTNGYGLKLTHARITLLNELLKGTFIELSVHSTPEQPTTLYVLFKNWLA
jgi:two-component system LytT family sensor kinase